jgi:hypothetical protein
MNGSSVYVTYKGKSMRVFVYHGLHRPSSSALEERAISTLERHEVNYPTLSLETIQEKMDLAMI